MGTVVETLHKVQNMDDITLLERFNHVTRAQAIREYLDKQEDHALNIQVRLAREEILKRMADRDPIVRVHFTEDRA